ncbi:MAG: ParB/RepB/Spo0J family partition protein [Bacillota bacterium]
MSSILGDPKHGPPEVTEIPVETIVLDPRRGGGGLDERAVADLAAAIKRRREVEPVIVRPAGNVFELVVGEKRLRAARLAGLKKVPAVVRDLDPREVEALALIESLQREDANVIEEARGYRRLSEEFRITQAEMGRLVGKSQSTIANKLRLLRLPESVQARLLEGQVSERHARALLELTDEVLQLRLLDEIRERGLSVRETEDRVRSLAAPEGAPPRRPRSGGARRRRGPSEPTASLFNGPTGSGLAQRGSPAALGQVGTRRAIRAFRDLRLFLNTFRRAVEMLREAGIRAEMTEEDGPERLEIRVVIPKTSAAGQRPAGLPEDPRGPLPPGRRG